MKNPWLLSRPFIHIAHEERSILMVYRGGFEEQKANKNKVALLCGKSRSAMSRDLRGGPNLERLTVENAKEARG